MSETESSFRPVNVTKRTTAIRRALQEIGLELAQLEHERRAHFYAHGDDTKQMLKGSGPITAKIQAAQARQAGLQEDLRAAAEADYQEALSSAESEFAAHLAAAVEQLRARATMGDALEQALGEVRRLLNGIDECNVTALRHISAASRDLPRRRSANMYHAVQDLVKGAYAGYGLLGALSAAGLGTKGIRAGIIMDTAQMPRESIASGMAQDLERIERHLGHWVQVAKGAGRDEPIVGGMTPLPPPPPKQIKWADQTDIPFGGQAPGRAIG